MNTYAEKLKESGLKATVQRLAMLKIIDHAGHISIDSLYQSIRDLYPTLSLATVYKNILMMVDKDVLVEVPLSGSKSQYELKKEDHMHLICEVCGTVEDKEVDEVLIPLEKKSDFLLSHSQINLYGTCHSCQNVS